MAIKASVNIQRDLDEQINYQVTGNAQRTFDALWQGYKDGYRAFNLIGSYGSGKSSFLWALQAELNGKGNYFGIGKKKLSQITVVGDSISLRTNLANELGCEIDDQAIFKSLKDESKKVGANGIVLLQIDEVGKHLEFAAKNKPEEEIYFVQKLAETVSASNSKILLIMTLHQSFDAYANKLSQETKNEWEKVKGRFNELVFNETPESLLEIGANYINCTKTKYKWSKNDTEILKASVLNITAAKYKELGKLIFPLDVLTGKCLVQAFQRYGQNNRSLFSFLQSTSSDSFKTWSEKNEGFYNISIAFDYVYANFYHYLSTSGNKDYLAWNSILNAIDRANSYVPTEFVEDAVKIIKTIGFVRLFSNAGVKINNEFLTNYWTKYGDYNQNGFESAVNSLIRGSIIRFRNWEKSYSLVEGTDIDIENELITVGERISDSIDIVGDIKRRINFEPIAARRISFQTGIPRFFEIIPTEKPYLKASTREFEGEINLLVLSQIESCRITF